MKKFFHIIGYNFQGNNLNFLKKFSGWWQCMTTSAWMLMSLYSGNIKATDDNALAAYLDDVEAEIGKPGIAEWVKRKYSWIKGRTSLWWLVQKHGIEKWLWHQGIRGTAKFYNKTMTYEILLRVLPDHPVMIGTNKIGGLPGGHIILAIGFDENQNIICHDPAGNATTKYKNRNGSMVVYPVEYLHKFTCDKFYALHWVTI